MHPIYSLDNAINSFFESQSTVTRQQCDELAASLVGEPVNPAPIRARSLQCNEMGRSESAGPEHRGSTPLAAPVEAIVNW